MNRVDFCKRQRPLTGRLPSTSRYQSVGQTNEGNFIRVFRVIIQPAGSTRVEDGGGLCLEGTVTIVENINTGEDLRVDTLPHTKREKRG